MRSKLKIIIPLAVLLALGGAYKFVLAKPAKGPPPKVHGQVYVLPKEFLVNLRGGRFAKVNIALVLDHSQATAPAKGHGGEAKPPDGWGTLEQEAIVRAIVTDTLTDTTGDELIGRGGREHLKHSILRAMKKHSDVKVNEVLITDLAVQ